MKILKIFSYEMCGHPSSLFDASGLLREAQKPQLANAIAEQAYCDVNSTSDVVVGEDSDLLVLLCHYQNNSGNNIYFTSDLKSGTKRKRIWDINKTKVILGT